MTFVCADEGRRGGNVHNSVAVVLLTSSSVLPSLCRSISALCIRTWNGGAGYSHIWWLSGARLVSWHKINRRWHGSQNEQRVEEKNSPQSPQGPHVGWWLFFLVHFHRTLLHLFTSLEICNTSYGLCAQHFYTLFLQLVLELSLLRCREVERGTFTMTLTLRPTTMVLGSKKGANDLLRYCHLPAVIHFVPFHYRNESLRLRWKGTIIGMWMAMKR